MVVTLTAHSPRCICSTNPSSVIWTPWPDGYPHGKCDLKGDFRQLEFYFFKILFIYLFFGLSGKNEQTRGQLLFILAGCSLSPVAASFDDPARFVRIGKVV